MGARPRCGSHEKALWAREGVSRGLFMGLGPRARRVDLASVEEPSSRALGCVLIGILAIS